MPAGKRPRVVELVKELDRMSNPATAAEEEACPEEHRLLVYEAETPQPSSVGTFLAKKRTSLLSPVQIGGQCRNMMRDGNNKAVFGAELRLSAKTGEAIAAKPADSGALRLEAGSAYQLLKVTVKRY